MTDELEKEILERHFDRLRKYANVLNINIGNEIKNGVETGQRAIIVYVSKKKMISQLKKKERLPDSIENIPIDVIEFSPDYEMGDTAPSQLKPEEQKRIAGGVKKNEK
jgi:hypothetical protein